MSSNTIPQPRSWKCASLDIGDLEAMDLATLVLLREPHLRIAPKVRDALPAMPVPDSHIDLHRFNLIWLMVQHLQAWGMSHLPSVFLAITITPMYLWTRTTQTCGRAHLQFRTRTRIRTPLLKIQSPWRDLRHLRATMMNANALRWRIFWPMTNCSDLWILESWKW